MSLGGLCDICLPEVIIPSIVVLLTISKVIMDLSGTVELRGTLTAAKMLHTSIQLSAY